jgi:hypothetical protein
MWQAARGLLSGRQPGALGQRLIDGGLRRYACRRGKPACWRHSLLPHRLLRLQSLLRVLLACQLRRPDLLLRSQHQGAACPRRCGGRFD